MGTGVNGNGMAICAKTAVTAVKIPIVVSSLVVSGFFMFHFPYPNVFLTKKVLS